MTPATATDRRTQIKALADFCGVMFEFNQSWNPFEDMTAAMRVQRTIGDGRLWHRYMRALRQTTGEIEWETSPRALFNLVNATAQQRAEAAYLVISGKV